MFNKIIVLGMDNTGKTTLCRDLSKLLGYKHMTSLGPKATYMEMTEFIEDNLIESEESIVFERFCLFEEMVYGEILRGASKFDWGGLYFNKLMQANPLIIYCRPSRDRIFSFGLRDQMEGVIEKRERLLATFDDLYFKLQGERVFTTVYDFEASTAEELANRILLWKGVNQ